MTFSPSACVPGSLLASVYSLPCMMIGVLRRAQLGILPEQVLALGTPGVGQAGLGEMPFCSGPRQFGQSSGSIFFKAGAGLAASFFATAAGVAGLALAGAVAAALAFAFGAWASMTVAFSDNSPRAVNKVNSLATALDCMRRALKRPGSSGLGKAGLQGTSNVAARRLIRQTAAERPCVGFVTT